MRPTRNCRQAVVIGTLVVSVLFVAVNAGGTKHVPEGPLPPEMKTQPEREAPRIPTAPGERKQYPTPQPTPPSDPSRPVKKQIEFDLVRVSRMWSEPDRVTTGQIARLKMEIHNVSSGELRNVGWRIRKVFGLGAFDSGVQSVPAIGAGRTAVVAVDWAATLETLGGHSFEGSVDVAGDRLPGNNKGVVTLAVDRRRITKQLIAQQVEGPSWFARHEYTSMPPVCNYGMGYNAGNPEFSIRCGPGVGWKVDFMVYRLAPDLINGWVVSDVRLGLPSWADSSYRLADWVTKPAGTSLNGVLKTLIDPLDPNRRSPVGGQVAIWVTGPEGLPMLPPSR